MLSQNNKFFIIVNLDNCGRLIIFLKAILEQYSNNSRDRKYKILIDSNYEKIMMLLKDSTGNVTDLKLISTIDVTLA